MSDRLEDLQGSWEGRLLRAARELPYPATPDLAGRARRAVGGRAPQSRRASRRLAWLGAAVLLLALLLAVPPVRAAVLEFLQLGAVRIWLGGPPATPTAPAPTPAAQAAPGLAPTFTPPAAVTEPLPTPTVNLPSPLVALEEIAGLTTLEEVREQVAFPIPLPAYPAGLGEPDRVYLQDQDEPLVVLVWLAEGPGPERARLALHLIAPGSWAIEKVRPEVVQVTRVNGGRALWTEGPYVLRLTNGDLDFRRVVTGHVLIWEAGEVTYRLETDLPLEEAVRVAESLQEPPESP